MVEQGRVAAESLLAMRFPDFGSNCQGGKTRIIETATIHPPTRSEGFPMQGMGRRGEMHDFGGLGGQTPQ